MFGYIVPIVDELTPFDYQNFKSYYCGLCISLKYKYGNLPRLGLNYDATFFAILMDSISNEPSETFTTFCLKHPLKKVELKKLNSALDYATDLNILLIYYKLLDNEFDETGFKKIAFSKLFKGCLKKVTYQNINKILFENLNVLNTLELSDSLNSIDELAHPFSNIIGEILKECPFTLHDESLESRNRLYDFGYSFGKWIYLIDAIDDLKDDMELDRFNPINKVYNKENLEYKEFLRIIKDPMDFLMITLEDNCSELLNKLPIIRNKNILTNIINFGLMEKYMNISKCKRSFLL